MSMKSSTSPTSLPLQKLLDALLDTDQPLHPRFLYRLSDLEPAEIKHLKEAWPRLPQWRRQALLEDIEEIGSTDTLLDFGAFCRLTVEDEDARVRLLAVRVLWDYQDNTLIPLWLEMLKTDPDAEVRAAAATALGLYVYLGEIEELPEKTLHNLEDHLLQVLQGNDETHVRRCALEALGFSTRPEIPALIETAYASTDKDWIVSALFAMGRSSDHKWQPKVLAMLEHKLPVIRSEAARAAGELEMTQAAPILVDLLKDPDDTTRAHSIWSLSQIGGEGVREILEQMVEETEDEDELTLLEEALENLTANESLGLLPLLDFPETLTEDVKDSYADQILNFRGEAVIAPFDEEILDEPLFDDDDEDYDDEDLED